MNIEIISIETEDDYHKLSYKKNTILLKFVPDDFRDYLEKRFKTTIDSAGYDSYDMNTRELIAKERWCAIKTEIFGTLDSFYNMCEKISEAYKDFLYEKKVLPVEHCLLSQKTTCSKTVMMYSHGFPVEDNWYKLDCSNGKQYVH
jgi:hypothetical protein